MCFVYVIGCYLCGMSLAGHLTTVICIYVDSKNNRYIWVTTHVLLYHYTQCAHKVIMSASTLWLVCLKFSSILIHSFQMEHVNKDITIHHVLQFPTEINQFHMYMISRNTLVWSYINFTIDYNVKGFYFSFQFSIVNIYIKH